MHRFFVDPAAIAGDSVALTGDQARQIARVLRLRPGDTIAVLDNSGSEYAVELTSVSVDLVEGDVTTVEAIATEPCVHLTLFQSLLKAEKFEWVLQKGVEVGISAFVPVWTDRSIVPLAAAAGKTERWASIIREAAEQSHRTRLPALETPVALEEALKQRSGPMLIPWEEEKVWSLRTALEGLGAVQDLGIVIGPEGGFSGREVDFATSCGAVPVTLGPRILRTETAGLVTAAAILYHYGQLGD